MEVWEDRHGRGDPGDGRGRRSRSARCSRWWARHRRGRARPRRRRGRRRQGPRRSARTSARAAPEPDARPAPAPAAAAGRVRASPAARARARELGVELGRAAGTGPGGAVTRADVEAGRPESPRPPPLPPRPAGAVEGAARRAGRRACARPSPPPWSRSKREIPHYYLATELDLSRRLRPGSARTNERPARDRAAPPRALAAQGGGAARRARSPEMNGVLRGRRVPAVARRSTSASRSRSVAGGLVAPALHDVDRKALGEVMRELTDLVARTRARRPAQLRADGRHPHRHEPRRPGRRHGIRRHLPAPGGARRLRTRAGAPVGSRRSARGASGRERDALRRPPGERRHPGSAVPRVARSPSPGSGGFCDARRGRGRGPIRAWAASPPRPISRT